MKNSLKTFYVGIKSVIVNPNTNKALVLIRNGQDGKSYYDIPGGRIDSDENINTTLQRELKEEILNIGSFKVESILNAYRLSHDLNDGYGLLLIFHKVVCDIEDVQLSQEHYGYKWISKSEIDLLKNQKDIIIEDGYAEALRLALES